MGCPFRGGSRLPHMLPGASPQVHHAFKERSFAATTITASATLGPALVRTSASLAVAATYPNNVLKPGPPRQLNPNEIRHIVHVDRLAELLSLHPDPSFFSYVCSGMRPGFSVGYAHAPSCFSMSPSHPSALSNKDFVWAYLQSCVNAGKTAQPFPSPLFPCIHVPGLGMVPKQNGKVRLIHDLSSPSGTSVNDGIPREAFSLTYETVNTAISSIMKFGKGAFLTKVDIRNTFRICPVCPSDWPFLCIYWDGQYNYDKVLPFGLRSAPYIFDKFAAALNWILHNTCHLTDIIHNLDDFLDVSPPHTSIAAHHHALILDIFSHLNVPVAPEKVEGPSTCLTFLGLELDTIQLEIRLPDKKRTAYLATVSAVQQSGTISKRELASVLGNLSFASRAMPAGRTFLRRLYDLDRATRTLPPSRPLKIPQSATEDLKWWQSNLQAWNGKSFFLLDGWRLAADMLLQADASGTLGYGAFYASRWLRGNWQANELCQSREYKELYAIVAACSTWGSAWQRLRIQFQCDNSAVVACIRSGTCRSCRMTLIRAL